MDIKTITRNELLEIINENKEAIIWALPTSYKRK